MVGRQKLDTQGLNPEPKDPRLVSIHLHKIATCRIAGLLTLGAIKDAFNQLWLLRRGRLESLSITPRLSILMWKDKIFQAELWAPSKIGVRRTWSVLTAHIHHLDQNSLSRKLVVEKRTS